MLVKTKQVAGNPVLAAMINKQLFDPPSPPGVIYKMAKEQSSSSSAGWWVVSSLSKHELLFFSRKKLKGEGYLGEWLGHDIGIEILLYVRVKTISATRPLRGYYFIS